MKIKHLNQPIQISPLSFSNKMEKTNEKYTDFGS
jgi:hypothetical protein